MKYITAVLFLWFITYIIGSIIAWDLNPGNWALIGRILMGILDALFIIAALEVHKDDTN